MFLIILIKKFNYEKYIMNTNGNPILIELAEQLPSESKIYQMILTSQNYVEIIAQAKEDFFSFGDMDSVIKNGEKGFLALKIVEIIGEDNISNLDPETIYFITHLLNKANLTILRNKVIVSALPLRT